MIDMRNAAGAPPPTASHELLDSGAIVPPAATGDQRPRGAVLVASTAYSDPDDTEATVLLGVDYTPAQLDEIAEHAGCAVLSTPATAEEVAAGAVPGLGLTLADYDDVHVVSADSPRLAENAVDRIAAEIADHLDRKRPEVRDTITVAHLHRGTDVHLQLSNGRAVEDINGHHVLGPERSTTSTTSTPGDHRSHRERAFAEARADKLADLRIRRMSRENPPPRLEPLVEDLLDRYTTGFIAGLPGEGKTWTDVDLACAVATGRPFAGGHATHQGPVVILAGEGEQVTLDRIRAWERAHLDEGERIPFDMLMVIPGAEDLRDPDSAVSGAVVDAVAEVEPVLVIIDTLNRYSAGADENAAADMSAFIKVLDKIRNGPTRPHVSVTHHTSKAGADLRGSSSLRGAADVVLMTRKVQDGFEVWTSKQRGREEGPVGKFTLEPVEWTEEVDGEPRTVSSARVVWDILGPGVVGVSPREIPDKLLTGYTGLDESGLPPAQQMYVVIRVLADEDGMTPAEAQKHYRALKTKYNTASQARAAWNDSREGRRELRYENGGSRKRHVAATDCEWAADPAVRAAIRHLQMHVQTAAGGLS